MTMMTRGTYGCLVTLLAMGLVSRAPEARADDDEGGSRIESRALSANPDRVSGGDVLVKISLPRAARHDSVMVTLHPTNQDVTASFRETAPGILVGLVSGLVVGENRLTVRAEEVGTESLRLTNYPITGPITSGPHIQPFICQTQTFRLPVGTTRYPIQRRLRFRRRGAGTGGSSPSRDSAAQAAGTSRVPRSEASNFPE